MATTDPKTTSKPDDAPAASAPAPAKAAAPSGGAGASGDPEVQRLLAMRDGHQMNRDLLDPPVVDKAALDAADEALAEVDDRLAELGYPQESQADRKARLAKDAKAAAKADADAAKRREDRAAARDKARTADASV